MAAKTTMSKLKAKLGSRLTQAHNAHKEDETTYGGGGALPEIEIGIAQLTRCEITQIKADAQYNPGCFQFDAEGTIQLPVEVTLLDPKGKPKGTVKVEGRKTYIRILLDDQKYDDGTERTLDQNIDKMLNEFRKLGIETKGLTEDDYEVTAEALEKAAPLFKFRTWQGQARGKFKARMNHEWNGIDDVETIMTQLQGSEPSQAVNDQSGDQPADDMPFGDELDDLVASANDADPEVAGPAQEDLTARALGIGVSQDQIDSDDATWEDVAQWIRDGAAGSDGGESEGEESGDDLDSLGATADEEYAAGDTEGASITRLNELATENGIEPNDYATYAELAEALKEFASSGGDEVDYDQLGIDADEEYNGPGAGEACAQLEALAESAGLVANDYATYVELAEALKPADESESAEDVDENAWIVKGALCSYAAMGLDPKTKKPKRMAASDHEVTAVNAAGETVTLKSLETGKVLVDAKTKKPIAVPFDEIAAV